MKKSGILGFFKRATQNSHEDLTIFSSAILIISHLQIIATYTFSFSFQNSTHTNFQSFLDTISNLFTGINTNFITMDPLHTAIVIITLSIHLFLIAVLAWELYLLRNLHSFDRKLSSKLEKFLIIFLYTLSQPLFNVVIRFVFHKFDGDNSSDVVFATMGLLLIILNFLISSQNFINVPLKTQNQLCAKSNHYLAYTVSQKFIISFLLISYDETQTNPEFLGWVLAFVSFGLSIMGLQSLFTKSSYYYVNSQDISFKLQTLVLSMSIVELLIKFANLKMLYEDYSIIVMVIYIPLVKFLENYDSGKQIEELNNFLGRGFSSSFETKNLIKIYELVQRRVSICPDDRKISIDDFKSLVYGKIILEYDKENKENIDKKILAHLDKISEKSKSNHEKLTCAHLYFILSNDFKAYNICTSLLDLPILSLNLKLGAYWVIEQIITKYEKNQDAKNFNEGLKNYFLSLKKQDEFSKMMSQALKHYRSFYDNLNESNPCLYNCSKQSIEIQTALKKIQSFWDEITQENIESTPHILIDYGLFNMAIKVDKEKGIRLLKLYEQLVIKTKNVRKSNQDLQFSLAECVYFELSIEKFTLGNITSGNFENIQSQLGYNHKEILDKNVSMLFPEFLRDHFSHKIRKFIENCGESSGTESEHCLLIHKEKYISPYICKIMTHPILDGHIKILCQFIPEKIKREIVVITGKKVEAATKLILYELNAKTISNNGSMNFDESSLESMGYQLEPIAKNSREAKILITFELNFNLSEAIDSKNQLSNENSNTRCYFATKIETNKSKLKQKSQQGNANNEEDYDELLNEHNIDAKKFIYLPKSIIDKTLENETVPSSASKYLSDSQSENSLDVVKKNLVSHKVKKSVASGETEAPHGKVKSKFDSLLTKMSLFKFNQRYLLFFSFSILLMSMAITLLLSYSTATYAVDQVKISVNLIKNLYGRTAAITDIARNAYVYSFINQYYQPGTMNASIAATAAAALPRVKAVSDYNTNVRSLLDELDDENVKRAFFEKNIRVYYDNFDSILNATTYQMHDSFGAVGSLLSVGRTFANNYRTNSSDMIRKANYLLILSMNDLFISCKSQPGLVDDALTNILDKSNEITLNAFIASGISLALYFVTLMYVFSSHFQVCREFLASIINVSPEFLHEIASDLNEFDKRLQGSQIRNHAKTFSMKMQSAELKKKNEKRLGIKVGNHKILFLQFFVYKSLFMILLILPSTILLWITYTYPDDTKILVNKKLKDLTDINDIGVGVAELITDSNYFDYVSFSFTHNSKPSPIYERDIQALDELISADRGFSEEVLSYMNIDLCPYWIKTALVTGCYDIISGQTQKGIYNVIYFIKSFYTGLKAFSEKITDPGERARQTSSVPVKVQVSIAGLNVLLPAIRTFSDEITDSLTRGLESKISTLIILFGVSIAFDFVVLFVAMGWISSRVIRGRMMIANTLKIVPLEFVAMNKSLRFYLMKESRDFLKLSKDVMMFNKN